MTGPRPISAASTAATRPAMPPPTTTMLPGMGDVVIGCSLRCAPMTGSLRSLGAVPMIRSLRSLIGAPLRRMHLVDAGGGRCVTALLHAGQAEHREQLAH